MLAVLVGVSLASRPWGTLFLPAGESILVKAGTEVSASVGFDPGPRGEPSWMRWALESGDQRFSAHEFRSFPSTASDLTRQSPSWTPLTTSAGRTAQRILELADGSHSVHAITTRLIAEGLVTNDASGERLVEMTLRGRAL